MHFKLSREPSKGVLVDRAMQKRAVLFDIDGTLVDSNDAHVDAWRRAFADEGYSFSRPQIHAQVGKGGDNLVPSLLPGLAPQIQQRLIRAHGEIYKTQFLPHVRAFDGAKELLIRLAALRHTLVLASSASRAEVDYYIELLEAEGLLSGSTSKDDVASSKPCPDIFTAALGLTGSGGQAAIVIGDTPNDIVAARRAGIESIAMLSGGFERDTLASYNPLAIYRDLGELDASYGSSPLCSGERADA